MTLKRRDDFTCCGVAYLYLSGSVAGASAGSLYRLRIDGERDYPDPASRFQPSDVHGPSEVISPTDFEWSDNNWRGRGTAIPPS